MKLIMSKAEKKELKESFENKYDRKLTYKMVDKFLKDLIFKKFSCGVLGVLLNDFVDEEDYRKENDRRESFREKWGTK